MPSRGSRCSHSWTRSSRTASGTGGSSSTCLTTTRCGRAWQVVMRDVTAAFYSHPWAWNEIGFGGPAYPRGYAAFGSPHLGETEDWEEPEAFSRDPVRDTRRRGLD